MQTQNGVFNPTTCFTLIVMIKTCKIFGMCNFCRVFKPGPPCNGSIHPFILLRVRSFVRSVHWNRESTAAGFIQTDPSGLSPLVHHLFQPEWVRSSPGKKKNQNTHQTQNQTRTSQWKEKNEPKLNYPYILQLAPAALEAYEWWSFSRMQYDPLKNGKLYELLLSTHRCLFPLFMWMYFLIAEVHFT